ncbi:MAG: phosphatase PAP2 family protein [Archangium sp.]|nr:phosphatase PAP2 family protein [Archangium sp.]MDP3153096.1 phosphatase PAP2 family protein [Archangium sp.]MDP3572229.1 phosphatase PAP2 family protein [Archangium sp.]
MRSLLETIAQWDTRSSLALQSRRARLPNLFFSALSWSGAGGVWFGLAGVLMLTHGQGLDFLPRQLSFLVAMTAALAALLVGGLIKRMVGRRRPFATERGIEAAIWAPGPRRSFPSTHAATAVALAVALFAIDHPLAPWVALWALGVSFSRVWLGVHFPSDVVSGAALGIGFGLLPWERLVQF